VKDTNPEALHYPVFSIIFLLGSSYFQIFPSTHCFWTQYASCL